MCPTQATGSGDLDVPIGSYVPRFMTLSDDL